MNKTNQSSVTIFRTDSQALLILVKKTNESDYFLFTVSTITGSISFDGINGSSVFPSLNTAIDFIQSTYKFEFSDVKNGIALIGLAVYGPYLFIPIITDSTICGRIKNAHTIRLIKEVDFITIELPFHRTLTPKEIRRINRIKDFPLSGYHLWCDTYDLTTPLVSKENDISFKWNSFWTEAFENIHQGDACISMLQGCVTCKILNIQQEPHRFTIMSFRQCNHGGTRYYARGLNYEGFAANEVRSEIIVESNSGRVWSHEWRRGTAPVSWKNIVGTKLPTVSLIIEDRYDEYTPAYFSRFLQNYSNIDVINLMHNEEGHQEKELCDAYKNAIKHLSFIQYHELDWHKSVKEQGMDSAVQFLYSKLEDPEISYSPPEVSQPISQCSTNLNDNEAGGRHSRSGSHITIPCFFFNEKQLKEVANVFEKIQKKVVRFNCMDSLDRTNVACFYYASMIIIKILFEIGVISNTQCSLQTILDLPFEIKKFLAESFVSSGDTISFLYTNTQACMTHVFTDIAGIENKNSSDSTIAIQRRYHNLLNDKNRQKAIDTFCGRKLDLLLPDLVCGNIPLLLSSFPAHFVQPPVSNGSSMIDPSVLLRHSLQSHEIHKASHFLLQLSEFAYVTSIALVLCPPSPPLSFKIGTSLTYFSKLPLLAKVALPSVDSLEIVFIRIPADYSSNFPISRFLHFEFESKGCSFSLSNIFVFGHRKLCIPSKFGVPKPVFPYQPIEIAPNSLKKMISELTKTDYLGILYVENARLDEKVSKLECASMITESGFNPMDMILSSSRLHLSPMVTEMSHSMCVGCNSLASWGCWNCRRFFCSGNCAQHFVCNELFFFDTPAELCDQCNSLHSFMGRNLITVYNKYEKFYSTIDPLESSISEWISNLVIKPSYSPTEFPNALIVSPKLPQDNLILTSIGGMVSGPASFRINFASSVSISSVNVEGEDLKGFLKDEILNEKILFETEGSYQWSIKTNSLDLTIKSGKLTKLLFKAEPVLYPTLPSPVNKKTSRKFDIKPFKQLPMNSKRESILDSRYENIVSGLVFTNLIGVNAIIITLEISNQTRKSRGFFIPKTSPHFVLEFKEQEPSRQVSVLFIDISPEFVEPKIEVF